MKEPSEKCAVYTTLKTLIVKRASMETLVIGDSNIRNCYEKDIFDKKLGSETSLIQTTSKASLKLVLEETKSDKKIVIFYNSWLNEIVGVCKNKNDEKKDKEIHVVVSETIDILRKAATENPNMILIVMKPLRRGSPGWVTGKLPKINEEIMDCFYKTTPPKNIRLVGAPEMPDSMVMPDHTHFSLEGNQKVQDHVINEILKANEEVEVLEMDIIESSQEEDGRITRSGKSKKWGVTKPISTPSQITPRGKRMREETDETETSSSEKCMRKMDSFIDEMKLMCKQLSKSTEENTKNISKNYESIKKLDSGLDSINEKLTDNHKTLLARIEQLEKQQQERPDQDKKSENITSAKMREDLDAFENERLRDTIFIKKLTSDVEMPHKHSDLLQFVREVANSMVVELLGKPAHEVLKYTGLAFPATRAAPPKSDKNEIPPIKMQFKSKELATEFRSKAIILAKKPNSRYAGAYLVYPVNAATRIRIAILWEISKALKNEGTESWVAQSSCKPTLMVRTGQYPKAYTYVQAVLEYGDKVKTADLEKPGALATKFFPEESERIFIILRNTKV